MAGTADIAAQIDAARQRGDQNEVKRLLDFLPPQMAWLARQYIAQNKPLVGAEEWVGKNVPAALGWAARHQPVVGVIKAGAKVLQWGAEAVTPPVLTRAAEGMLMPSPPPGHGPTRKTAPFAATDTAAPPLTPSQPWYTPLAPPGAAAIGGAVKDVWNRVNTVPLGTAAENFPTDSAPADPSSPITPQQHARTLRREMDAARQRGDWAEVKRLISVMHSLTAAAPNPSAIPAQSPTLAAPAALDGGGTPEWKANQAAMKVAIDAANQPQRTSGIYDFSTGGRRRQVLDERAAPQLSLDGEPAHIRGVPYKAPRGVPAINPNHGPILPNRDARYQQYKLGLEGPMRREIYANAANDKALAGQDLVSRGLSNTTIRPSVMSGINYQRDRALGNARLSTAQTALQLSNGTEPYWAENNYSTAMSAEEAAEQAKELARLRRQRRIPTDQELTLD